MQTTIREELERLAALAKPLGTTVQIVGDGDFITAVRIQDPYITDPIILTDCNAVRMLRRLVGE